MRHGTVYETIAARLLARGGIAVVWELHLRAAASYRRGNWISAVALISVAEAAEQALMGRAARR